MYSLKMYIFEDGITILVLLVELVYEDTRGQGTR